MSQSITYLLYLLMYQFYKFLHSLQLGEAVEAVRSQAVSGDGRAGVVRGGFAATEERLEGH